MNAGGATKPASTKALNYWIEVAMPATRLALEEGKLKKLTTFQKDGIIVVTGRAEQGIKKYYGVTFLPVLMSSERVSYLIMLDAHNKDHSNRDVTLATSTETAWIVGGKTLAAKLKDTSKRRQ